MLAWYLVDQTRQKETARVKLAGVHVNNVTRLQALQEMLVIRMVFVVMVEVIFDGVLEILGVYFVGFALGDDQLGACFLVVQSFFFLGPFLVFTLVLVMFQNESSY